MSIGQSIYWILYTISMRKGIRRWLALSRAHPLTACDDVMKAPMMDHCTSDRPPAEPAFAISRGRNDRWASTANANIITAEIVIKSATNSGAFSNWCISAFCLLHEKLATFVRVVGIALMGDIKGGNHASSPVSLAVIYSHVMDPDTTTDRAGEATGTAFSISPTIETLLCLFNQV